MNEIKQKLSADPGAMVLGIISILICIVGCCCGLLTIPAIIMSIIGIVWAVNSQKAYRANPDQYVARSYNSVNTAKIINIIALVLGVIFLTISLIWFGKAFTDPNEFFERLERGDFYEVETETETYEYDSEDSSDEVDTWEYQENVDSIPATDAVLEIEDVDTVNDSI